MVDLNTCLGGDPKARLVQFRAFVILRLTQTLMDCPWYRPISKFMLWRGVREEIASFTRWEKKVVE